MSKNEQQDNSENKEEVNSIAKFGSIAFQMVAVIGVFAFAGYKIDEAAGNKVKWVTAALSLVGVFIALYIIIRSVKS